jgi:DNA invertase Pin-like site-specific DNA recombinase
MNDLEELKYLLDYIKNVSSGGLKKVLAIYDVSRFSRNTAQALTILDDLKNNDIEVRFINDNLSTLTGFYNITIQLAAAQQLSDITSAKVRSAINFNRQHGFHTGGVSKIGYRVVNKRVVPDEHEIEVIKTVKRLQEEMKGVKNLHQNICNILNKNNIRLRGKPIPVSKVPLCLKRHIDLNL